MSKDILTSVNTTAAVYVANTGLGLKSIYRFTYDFTQHGGTGTIVLAQDDGPIPSAFIIQSGSIDIITPLNSAGLSTAAVSTGQGAGDLVIAAAFSVAPFSTVGPKATIPLFGTVATWIKTTAARSPTLVVAVADLTAGKFRLFIEGVQSST